MTKSKPWRRFLPILLAVLLALGIALYAVPYAQMVSYRNSAPVQTCAAQLAAAYGEKTSHEDICRDFSYLQRGHMISDTLPTEIVDLREGRPRYAMPITDTYTEYVDVTRSVTGTIRYCIQNADGTIQDNVSLTPLGLTFLNGALI